MNLKVVAGLFLLAASCFAALPSKAAECWIAQAIQKDDGAKLFFQHGNEDVPRVVIHSDGTRSTAVRNADGSFTLNAGDTIFLTEGLHSGCYAKLVRQERLWGLKLSWSVCMPGLKCTATERFMALSEPASGDAEPGHSSTATR
jgi:hypothetical protein